MKKCINCINFTDVCTVGCEEELNNGLNCKEFDNYLNYEFIRLNNEEIHSIKNDIKEELLYFKAKYNNDTLINDIEKLIFLQPFKDMCFDLAVKNAYDFLIENYECIACNSCKFSNDDTCNSPCLIHDSNICDKCQYYGICKTSKKVYFELV